MAARYLANRIISGALSYPQVVAKRPDLKPEIDAYLKLDGYESLIV